MKKIIAMIGVVVVLSTVIALVALPLGASATTALPNGLTAKIVATSGQKISGTIDATGYDIGIYIGPGAYNVKVTGATVSGANDEGILVQDTSNIVITDSTISNNAINAHEGLSEDKGIVLAGTTNVLVKNNTIEDNMRGGIALVDDGPNHPFALNTVATIPIASTGNVIMGNLIKDNAFDCGLVVSAKNPGGGVSNNVISKNTVEVTNPFLGGMPRVGGIIVAGGAFGPVQVMNNVILNNVVTGGLIPGISVHAFGPGAVISGTQLIGNVLSNNGAGELSGNTTGIEIGIVPGVIINTQILSDTVSNDVYGVWAWNATSTHIAHLQTTAVTTPVLTGP
jgi:parallel beta-helix repeat protein